MIDNTATTRDNVTVAVNVQLTARELNDLWSGLPVRYLVWLLLPIGLFYAYLAFATVVNDGFTSANALTGCLVWHGRADRIISRLDCFAIAGRTDDALWS